MYTPFATSGGGWNYVTSDDATETYNALGILQSITDRGGRTQTLTYSDGTTGPSGGYVLDASGNPTPSTLPSGLLIRVTDASGRALSFGYDVYSRIVTLVDPSGGLYHYAYDEASSIVVPGQYADNNLTSVTYPDGNKLIYWYNEQADTGGLNLPNALTGITDENGKRYSTTQYNTQGQAMATEEGPNMASPAGLYSLAYTTASGNPVSTAVTDPFGTPRTYAFTTILGMVKNTSLTQPCGTSCSGSSSSATTYDANGNVASRADFKGNISCYAYDLTRNLETTRVEGMAPGKACPSNLATYTPASGTVERKITTQWDANWHVPDTVAEPNKLISYSYDTNGNLLRRTEQQTTDATGGSGPNAPVTGTPRTWTYTYASPSQGLPGQVLTVDGPRTDVSDVTTYAYYTTTAADHAPGDLQSITNALGHVTTFDHYDGDGHVLQSTDPNGLVFHLTYDLRGRLLTKTSGTETTSYTYDPAGNLSSVLFPSGETYTYAYDDAHRLTSISDPDGNSVQYTLDAMSNRKQEHILDASDNVLYAHTRQFNALNQLYQDIGAVNQVTTFAYDSNGNIQTLQDPLGNTTQNQFDALNRLIASTAPDTGVIQTAYNGLDQLSSVTDPKNFKTVYTLDAWSGQLQTSSPDSGTTIRTFDTAGNLKTEKDARGITTTYTYDALNRVISKSSSSSGTAAYTYVYDATCGLDRLCSIQVKGVTQLFYSYDTHGRVTAKLDASSGTSLTSQYTYDSQGRLSQIEYPTGATVTYGYDARGRVNQVSAIINGANIVLASNFAYQPFGPVESFTFGNGLGYGTAFDQDYRVVQETSGPRVKSDTYDVASDLSILTDIDTTRQSYGYDANGRLTSGTDTRAIGWGALSWTYDKNGNRTTDTRNGVKTSYGYGVGSNQLAYTAPNRGSEQNRGYDAMGNTNTMNSSWFLSYDGYGRRITSTIDVNTVVYSNGKTYEVMLQDTSKYNYNALGQRTLKAPYATPTTIFHYGLGGQLLYEASGSNTSAYVYVNNKPLARIDNNSAIYYYHTDQLGAPQVMTDSTGTTVWSARTEPFGTAAVSTQTIVNNLRLPGQYFDAETGLHYNIFRDYDPTTGRYVESDPIGLSGGINGYGYAKQNPLSNTDPLGLKPWDWNGQGNTAKCGYYDAMAKEFPKCSYYKQAGEVCRGQNEQVNTLVRLGLRSAWTFSGLQDSQATVLNNIRDILIQQDVAAHEANLINKDGCACGNTIDSYHNFAFDFSGLPWWSYGGNDWPQGIRPNPVPVDPRNGNLSPGNWVK